MVEQHIRAGLRHAEGCSERRCVGGCGFAEFDDWLDGPVTAADAAADRLRKQRLSALLGGHISA